MMNEVDDFLAHFGKKGMRWGVRNHESTAPKGKNPSSSEINADQRKMTQGGQSLSHAPKGAPDPNTEIKVSDLKKSGLSRNQKIALGVGATLAVAGLAYYGNKKLGEFNLKQDVKKRNQQLDDEMTTLFGSGLNPRSQGKPQFYAGLRNGKALDRPEFTVSKTTQFQRLAGHPENGSDYTKGAYASFLTNDKTRYSEMFGYDETPYAIKFNPREDVRVPSTQTVLKSLKALSSSSMTDEQVLKQYTQLSGGGWKDKASEGLISSLKKQGYSALVDDMDAGFTGDLPLVFFGEATNLTATKRPKPPNEFERLGVGVSGRYA